MRKYFLCSKSMNRLLFYMAIFLRFVSHLLQFSTHEKLLYTKILEILWGFCRTLLFFGSCSRTRVISPKASPLFFGTPLTTTNVKQKGLSGWNTMPSGPSCWQWISLLVVMMTAHYEDWIHKGRQSFQRIKCSYSLTVSPKMIPISSNV